MALGGSIIQSLGMLGRCLEPYGAWDLGELPEAEAEGGAWVAWLLPQIWLWGGHSCPGQTDSDQTGPESLNKQLHSMSLLQLCMVSTARPLPLVCVIRTLTWPHHALPG